MIVPRHDGDAVPGYATDPGLRVAPETWSQRMAGATHSLTHLFSPEKLELLIARVSEHIPSRREKRLPRVVGWIRVRKSAGVSLKLRRVGWRHLCGALDPDRQAVVLTWGRTELDGDEQWIVNTCAKGDIPPSAFRRSVILRLRELVVVIPQKEHLADLNGRVLIVTDGELSIE